MNIKGGNVMKSAGRKFKELIEKGEIIVAPGAYDALTTKLIEVAGFDCAYMTGYGVAASLLGKPDIGLVTMTEMVTRVKNMAGSVEIPFIADGDTGYGGLLNVVRTVEEYENAGAAGIQLEDQVMPKRCGHMEGKELIPKDEMIYKIRAAIHARKDKDFQIVARTDARAVNGFDDAMDRARAFVEAGADIIFVEAPESVDEMKEINNQIKVPTLANMVEKGKTPLLTGKELEKIGYKMVIYPVSSLYCVAKSVLELLKEIKIQDTTKDLIDEMIPFDEFNSLISLNKMRELEKKFMK